MFCAKCGSQNADDYRFCNKCGTPRPQPNTEAPASAPAQGAASPSPNAYIPPQSAAAPPFTPQPQNSQPPYTAPPQPAQQPPYHPYGAQNAAAQPGGYPPMGGMPPAPVKKKKGGLIAALVLLGLMLVMTPIVILASLDNLKNNPGNGTSPTAGSDITLPGSYNVGTAPDGFRNNYTQIAGGGQDTVTVMIYMVGSDLESDGGYATMDISEMLEADLGDNVNVVLETGGCTDWSTPGILDGQVQRWAIEDGQLVELQQRGQIGMLSTDELRDFIQFSATSYPANRYQLIFWDHGGGSLYGYGSDELYPDSVLFLTDIARALSSTGVKFDVVGFDACLMGTIETAYMLEPYADYLIASEETEPAYGWNYTPWLNALGYNPSIDTVEFGAVVVDSFLEHNASQVEQGGPDTTLSIVALREIPLVYDTLCNYMTNASDALAEKEYTMISSAVARSKAFAEGDYDLIDLQDFIRRSDLEGGEELMAIVDSAVKYTDSSARSGVYGLSMYFPYTDLSIYGYAKSMFSEFGYGGEIYAFYDDFVNIMAGGQRNTTTRSLGQALEITDQPEAQTDYSGYEWYDNSAADSYSYDDIDYAELEILWDDTNSWWYLPLTDEDWSLITSVEMQILLDDGEGYIDLGSDQYYETDDNENLVLNYGADNTWVAIGGQVVCYYAEETILMDNGDTCFIGYVPAVLNGEKDIEIILQWDGVDAAGYIAGYRLTDTYSPFGTAGTLGKGYKQFGLGDSIDFVCDYYTYDGTFDSSYYFGETLVIGDTLPAVTYEDVGDGAVLECYMLVDVYQNTSWTETVEFSYDN
jgi:hypothetical protein